jgi:predicted esterase
MRFTFIVVLLLAGTATAGEGPWNGEWVTDLGKMVLTQNGNQVEGTYGEGGRIEGKASGGKLTLSWSRGRGNGDGSFEMQKGSASFTGKWSARGGGGNWRGWKKDPEAEKADTADFSGTWLSSLGTMVLTQKGNKVEGTYGSQGWSQVKGTVKGRRVALTWSRIQWSGPAWIEMTPDGTRFFGLTDSDKTKWLGVKLEGYTPDVKPKAGKIVQGISINQMIYRIRAPKGWRKSKKTDAIVLLHGSNWTTAGMIAVTPRNWPKIGKKFMLIGLQGESWADWSDPDDLRFNYTYINWCGRSTLKGYPYTDRESPFLVHQVVEDLKKKHNLGRIFVVGHSQGGFLAYYMYMHYPETFAGVAPLSCGLTVQCEPDQFEDEELLAAQRATPLAMVHGTQDAMWGLKQGDYIYDRMTSWGFPMVTYLKPNAPHAYDFLPIGDAVEWLDMMSTTDVKALVAFANERAKAKAWRDVSAALFHAGQLKARKRLAAAEELLEAAAAKDADRFLKLIEKNENAKWAEPFLQWKDQFEFTKAGKKVMAAYTKLQEEQDEKANQAINDARQAFRNGDQAAGYGKYEEILEQYPACRKYRLVTRWVAERK